MDLMYEPPDFVRYEAAGLGRFAEVMREDGWDRKRILALPDIDLPYWQGQSAAMRELLEDENLQPGRRILDVGSNSCWASNIFADLGLDVIALDITTTEMQGLLTAEYFFEENDVYFERMLSVMFDPALATASMDYVFCCEVLHHNDLDNLNRTFREMFRVLRPGGKLLVINEPMRFPLLRKQDHAEEVAQFEGYEHVFYFHEYYLAARRAGFRVKVREPTGGFFTPWTVTILRDTPVGEAVRRVVAHTARVHPLGRKLVLAYKSVVAGDVSLCMTATKPG